MKGVLRGLRSDGWVQCKLNKVTFLLGCGKSDFYCQFHCQNVKSRQSYVFKNSKT